MRGVLLGVSVLAAAFPPAVVYAAGGPIVLQGVAVMAGLLSGLAILVSAGAAARERPRDGD